VASTRNRISSTRRPHSPKKVKGPAESTIATPLTPALMPWLIIKHQPGFLTKEAPQFLRHRWKQENDYRQNPQRPESLIDPSLGFFFPARTAEPKKSPTKKRLAEFKRWTQGRSEQMGSRFTVRLESSFGPKVEAAGGWPRAVNHRLGTNFDGELASLKRRLNAEKHMHGFGGGGLGSGGFGGGGLGGGSGDRLETNSAKSENTEMRIARLEIIQENFRIPPREIDFYEEVPVWGYRYVIPNLDGSIRLSNSPPKFRAATGAWNPDEVKPAEPIHTLLRVDKEIWLPFDAGITPGRQSFIIEIEFAIDGGELAKAPPQYTKQAIGEYATGEIREDNGLYVILSSKLVGAWILHPKTEERLVQLDLKEYRQFQSLENHP